MYLTSIMRDPAVSSPDNRTCFAWKLMPELKLSKGCVSVGQLSSQVLISLVLTVNFVCLKTRLVWG